MGRLAGPPKSLKFEFELPVEVMDRAQEGLRRSSFFCSAREEEEERAMRRTEWVAPRRSEESPRRDERGRAVHL